MGRLPAEPRIARLLGEGRRLGHVERIALVAALRSERDPFRGSDNAGPYAALRRWSNSDVLDRVVPLEEYERSGKRQSEAGVLDANAAKFILRARDQLIRALAVDMEDHHRQPESQPVVDADEAVQCAFWWRSPIG